MSANEEDSDVESEECLNALKREKEYLNFQEILWELKQDLDDYTQTLGLPLAESLGCAELEWFVQKFVSN